jgi:hypothetical protein
MKSHLRASKADRSTLRKVERIIREIKTGKQRKPATKPDFLTEGE